MDTPVKIRSLVQKGHIEKALEEFLKCIEKDNPYYQELSVLSARFHMNENDDIKGTAERKEINGVKNQVGGSILKLLDKVFLENGYEEKTEEKHQVRIELILDGEFSEYSVKQQQKIIEQLAQLLNMDVNEIALKIPRKGSIIQPIELPKEKADLLQKLFDEGKLKELNVIGLEIVFEKEKDLSNQIQDLLKIYARKNKISETSSLQQPEIIPDEQEIFDSIASPLVTQDKSTILIIDDDSELHLFIRLGLQPHYQILEAEDGIQGFLLAQKHIPNLIIIDIMMPELDGLEFVKQLKQDYLTNQIPVIIVTAKPLVEILKDLYTDELVGILEKPFSMALLKERIKQVTNISAANQWMRDPFLHEVIHLIRRHLSGDKLTVDFLSKQLGMDRTHFYRKIKSKTGESPVQLIKQVSLQRAQEELLETNKSISEIAFSIGFRSPATFTRSFRKVYGMTPTAYRKLLR